MTSNRLTRVALIGGVGTHSDLSAALLSAFHAAGYLVVAVARSDRRAELESKLDAGAQAVFVRADLASPEQVQSLVEKIEHEHGAIDAYVHNAAELVRGPFLELLPDAFDRALRSNFTPALIMARTLLGPMLQRQRGTLLFAGATASVRGGAKFAPFAASKFALRGLCQSLAREFGSQGIHVAHVVIDGVIWGSRAEHEFKLSSSACIDAHALARTMLQLCSQDPSCWTHELDVRPASEKF